MTYGYTSNELAERWTGILQDTGSIGAKEILELRKKQSNVYETQWYEDNFSNIHNYAGHSPHLYWCWIRCYSYVLFG